MSGATGNSAHAVCRATSWATCGPWPSFMPTTAMIGSLHSRLRGDHRQARDEYPGVRRETPRDVRLKQTGPCYSMRSEAARHRTLCGVGVLRGPGRPGWLPTQVPHRSGLAHNAHPVPHLMNSRPARSVVGTWTWFRSRCTCQVSLQRLMRRHPLPSTGSLGLVPPLPTVL